MLTPALWKADLSQLGFNEVLSYRLENGGHLRSFADRSWNDQIFSFNHC